MDVYDIEPWCRAGNGGVIGRTLRLPLSHPQIWSPGPLPPELDGAEPLPGRPLQAARKAHDLAGKAIAVGFALLAARPDRPLAHAFNVGHGCAIDLALAGHDVLGYWAYLPTQEQLAIDARSLVVEAPGAAELSRLVRDVA